jgi:3-oxoacyl-ACP reductase-like protein
VAVKEVKLLGEHEEESR